MIYVISPLTITIIAKDNIATDAYIRFDYNNRAYYLRVGGGAMGYGYGCSGFHNGMIWCGG